MSSARTTRERAWAIAFGTVLLALVFLPVATNSNGFPLSNYPMFSKHRDTNVKVAHVVARSRTGHDRPVPPRLLDTAEIMQASQTAVVAAKSDAGAAELCARVAANVARAGTAWADVDRLELRTDRYDAVRYWQGERTPKRSQVHATCTIDREAPP
jgi:hypothetical protein